MIAFSPLRTKRLQIEMRELSGRNSIYLCHLPREQSERGATELIQRIVAPVEKPRAGQEVDPSLWSVQERALVVAHYLAHVIGGDFQIGEKGKFSDYLIEDGIGAPPDPIEVGEVADKAWFVQPLLGWHAEAIERLVASEELDNDQGGWLVGAMAAQMYHADQGPIGSHENTDVVIDAALRDRAVALTEMPESDFMALVLAYLQHAHLLDHIFRLCITDEGFAFLPAKEVPEGLPPARFHFSMAMREDTQELFGPREGIAD